MNIVSNPLFSVVLPNYNHALYLEKRISSILDQTFQDFELIILDDASTDNSIDIIQKYFEHPKVTCVILNKENSGSPFTQWSKGILAAKGSFIWIAESDDFADLNFLETVFEMFQNNSSISLVFTNSNMLDLTNQSESIAVSNIPTGYYNASEIDFFNKWFFLNDNFRIINASSCVFKKELVNNEILNKISLHRYSGDKLFWLLILKQNPFFGFVNRTLNFHTFHSQTTRSIRSRLANYQRAKELLEIYSTSDFIHFNDKVNKRKDEIGYRMLVNAILSVWFEKKLRILLFVKGLFMIKWTRSMFGKIYREVFVNVV